MLANQPDDDISLCINPNDVQPQGGNNHPTEVPFSKIQEQLHGNSEISSSIPELGVLKQHESTHKREKQYSDVDCNEKFSDRNSPGQSRRQCPKCGKTFSQKYFQRHLLIHSDRTPLQCTICNKKFLYQGSLKAHNRSHTGERPYRCEQCQKTFSRKDCFVVHLYSHSDKRPHQCVVCGRSFTREIYLANHKRIHTGERPYKCEECAKSFTQKNILTIHMRTHTRGKQYTSSHCAKAFSDKRELKQHAGEGPHWYPNCSKTFNQNIQNGLNVPMDKILFECVFCSRTFKRKSERSSHIESDHHEDKKYQCSKCVRTFKYQGNLNTHMDTHKFE